MIWPPQATGLFEYKTPCCECVAVAEFIIPVIVAPGYYSDAIPGKFADLSAAEAALADLVSNCIGYWHLSGLIGDPSTFDVTEPTVGTVRFDAAGLEVVGSCRVKLKAGALVTVSVSFSLSGVPGPGYGTSGTMYMYDDSGSLVQSWGVGSWDSSTTSGSASASSTTPAPVDGNYVLAFGFGAGGSPAVSSVAATWDITSDLPGLVALPVVAQYDDGSGGTLVLPCT